MSDKRLETAQERVKRLVERATALHHNCGFHPVPLRGKQCFIPDALGRTTVFDPSPDGPHGKFWAEATGLGLLMGLCLATPRRSLAVIDLDAEGASDFWRALVEKHGGAAYMSRPEGDDEPWRAHAWFQWGGHMEKPEDWPAGVDLKTSGYVRVPDHVKLEFFQTLATRLGKSGKDAGMPALTPAALGVRSKRQKPPKAATPRKAPPRSEKPASAGLTLSDKVADAKVANAVEGERHETLKSVVARMVAQGLGEDALAESTRHYGAQMGLPEDEVEKLLAWGLTLETLPEAAPIEAHPDAEFTQQLPFGRLYSTRQLRGLVAAMPPKRTVWWNFRTRELCMVFGRSNHGKSKLSQVLFTCKGHALGEEVDTGGRWTYMTAEDDYEDIVSGWGLTWNSARRDVLTMDCPLDMLDRKHMEAMGAVCAASDVVVLDTVLTGLKMRGSDMKDALFWQTAKHTLKKLAILHDCCVILLHHAPKNAETGSPYGDSAESVCDQIVQVVRNPDKEGEPTSYYLSQYKVRGALRDVGKRFTVQEGPGGALTLAEYTPPPRSKGGRPKKGEEEEEG